jgi:hypothetical protein
MPLPPGKTYLQSYKTFQASAVTPENDANACVMVRQLLDSAVNQNSSLRLSTQAAT